MVKLKNKISAQIQENVGIQSHAIIDEETWQLVISGVFDDTFRRVNILAWHIKNSVYDK